MVHVEVADLYIYILCIFLDLFYITLECFAALEWPTVVG